MNEKNSWRNWRNKLKTLQVFEEDESEWNSNDDIGGNAGVWEEKKSLEKSKELTKEVEKEGKIWRAFFQLKEN